MPQDRFLAKTPDQQLEDLNNRLTYAVKHTDKEEMLDVFDELRMMRVDLAAQSTRLQNDELFAQCRTALLAN